ncbi:MAG: hypothetical protein QOD07_434 [Frankiaceae bacterium]|jgi:hypothetical protein|nr:hypothetical protein [Frankiaceae bacterium]
MSGHRRWIRREAAPRRAVEPGTRGAEALDALLGEVRELRMTFVADLSTAAGAVEAGAPDVAADILDADRDELARFFRVADERLRELERAAHREVPANVVPMPTRSPSRTRRRVAVALPAVPLVGALTMAAAAAGVLPVPGTSTSTGTSHHGTSAIAAESNALRQFESVVNSDPSAQQVIAAADKLHRQIVALMATSKGDPAQANAIAQLLQAEQDLLLRAQPPGAQTVLAATNSLITQLKGHVKTVTPVIAPPKPADVAPKPASSSSPKPSPSPSKTAKPSPTPTHSSSPSPSSSPSSSSNPGPLPKVGG